MSTLQKDKVRGAKFPTFDMGRSHDQIALTFDQPAQHEEVHAAPTSDSAWRQKHLRRAAGEVASPAATVEQLEAQADAILEMAQEPARAMNMRSSRDFEADVPQDEVITEGIDHFQMRGRYLLFIQLLSLTAFDIQHPEKPEEYQDAKQFLENPNGFASILDLIGADNRHGQKIAKAVMDRPDEIHRACLDVVRVSQSDSTDFGMFMRMMGIGENGGRSSSYIEDDSVRDTTSSYQP